MRLVLLLPIKVQVNFKSKQNCNFKPKVFLEASDICDFIPKFENATGISDECSI